MGALLTPRLEALYRYPVKGMPGQSLPHVHLTAGQGLPLDRAFALTEGATPVEPNAHGWISSELLLRLRKHAELGLCRLEMEPDAVRLTAPDGREVRIPLDDTEPLPPGRLGEAGLLPPGPLGESGRPLGDPRALPPGPLGDARLVRPGAALWDWSDAPLSVINLDTVEALARAAGVPVDPLRFRANLYVSGLGAWRELDLPGARVQLGEAELEFTFPTERCRATTVRPGTGVRDLNVPALLASRFGHLYCGMYAKVVRGGRIEPGDRLVDRGRAPAEPRYTARLAEPGRPRYAELIRRTDESLTVTTFAFRDPAGGTGCRPGQHLRLHLADETGPLWRCYTLTGTTETELRISVKRVPDGRVSARLHTLPAGSQVLLSGPYGEDLTTSDARRPLLLAVAGIGITPVLPVLRALLDASPERPVTVLNVVRTSAETPLWEEALALLAKLPNAAARLYVTDPGPGLPYGARAGRPTTAELRELAADGTVEAYLCGPQGFVDTVRTALLSVGVPAAAVRDERFLSPRPVSLDERPPPEPGPFTVHFTASGTRTTWTADSGTLLDTAESAGLGLPSACRSGACGTCRKSVTGTVAHLTDPTAQLDAGEALLCCAVPVGDVAVHG
ncbi:MOSC domain-containing protein [Streptomyces sp. CA-249302]|uniref:MOSC domain-containing protein n=1 Tax=Streptomyces sp. CA-249302 TaxID=3240058 RepID=UPI003D91235D